MHLPDAGHQPGKNEATQPACRSKFRWRQRLPPSCHVTVRAFYCNPRAQLMARA